MDHAARRKLEPGLLSRSDRRLRRRRGRQLVAASRRIAIERYAAAAAEQWRGRPFRGAALIFQPSCDDRDDGLCDGWPMARDPKFALEVTIAYLRLATRDGGLPLDTPSGRAYTRDLRDMVERGDLVMLRAARASNRPDILHATPQGIGRLASVLERYGEDFGPISVLGHVENVRGR